MTTQLRREDLFSVPAESTEWRRLGPSGSLDQNLINWCVIWIDVGPAGWITGWHWCFKSACLYWVRHVSGGLSPVKWRPLLDVVVHSRNQSKINIVYSYITPLCQWCGEICHTKNKKYIISDTFCEVRTPRVQTTSVLHLSDCYNIYPWIQINDWMNGINRKCKDTRHGLHKSWWLMLPHMIWRTMQT